MSDWWRDAAIYEVYIRSLSDADGDGIGDLAGIRSRLSYLAELGVDAIWITPFYPSPMNDAGYDVADYCDVAAEFGDLATFDALLAEAHACGLRVLIDVVPNHTSWDHPWFEEARASRTSEKRDWYVFRPAGPDGSPPNDWQSVFGGSAWALDEPTGDYYLHLFDISQPDLNWRNPAVHQQFLAILRFWLDRGVDGFRIDVAHALYKDAALRDGDDHAWDQPEVHEVWKEWRRCVDGYDDRMLVGEVFLHDMERVATYVGPSLLHQAFNFVVAETPFEAATFRATITRALELFVRRGTTPTWVLSNHDLERHVSRFGGGDDGRRRALAATVFLMGLPGSPYIYQGEELALAQTDVPPDARRDPMWVRSGIAGRDGCRTPMPWTAEAPGFGFTMGAPWLPFDPEADVRNVERQAADEESPLNLYRTALHLRRGLRDSLGSDVTFPDAPAGCVAVSRPAGAGSRFHVLMNLAADPVTWEVPEPDAQLLLRSRTGARLEDGTVTVPGECTVWLGPAT